MNNTRHEYTGNKEGNIIELTQVSDEFVYLEVGDCCVYRFQGYIPVVLLTKILGDTLQNKNIVDLINDSTYPLSYKKELEQEYNELVDI